MKFKASLTAALNAADLVSVDGFEVEGFGVYPTKPWRWFELADETQVSYAEQEIEIDDGQAFFNDTDGDEHEIILCVHRHLQQGDLR